MNKGNTYKELIDFGQKLLKRSNLEEGLPLISEYLRNIIHAMRCSIFIYNTENDTLWTVLATGIETIEIPSDKGIVGYVFHTGESVIENNIENNPYFLKDVDKESGYKTINMLTYPINNAKDESIGVLQLINKLEGFHEEDLQFLTLFTNFISSFIELETYYRKAT